MDKGGTNILVGVDEKISYKEAFILGLQHVLAMDLYIVPIILASLLALDQSNTAFFIQMSFLAAGIATLIQTGFCMRYPIMQGPSYIPIAALAAIGSELGLRTMIGSLIPGAIILILLGFPLRFLAKIISKFIPPIVGGTVIIIVGISLMPVAMNNIFTAPGNLGNNAIIGLFSAALLITCMLIGTRFTGAGKVLRIASVIIALVGGTLFASTFGILDFSAVKKAAWFSLPKLFPFGTPIFELKSVLTMIFIYLVVLVETTGTWFAVSAVTGTEIPEKRLNSAAVGEGLGCLVGALFGGTPMTGYSTNAGIIAVTGVASRMAIMAGGVILILLGFIPKVMNIIACIPGVVINGIFGVVCVIIAMNGFRAIQNIELNERNMMVIGIPILFTLGANAFPKDVLYTLPSYANYILSSGMAVGALSTVILNIILPPVKSSLDSR